MTRISGTAGREVFVEVMLDVVRITVYTNLGAKDSIAITREELAAIVAAVEGAK